MVYDTHLNYLSNPNFCIHAKPYSFISFVNKSKHLKNVIHKETPSYSFKEEHKLNEQNAKWHQSTHTNTHTLSLSLSMCVCVLCVLWYHHKKGDKNIIIYVSWICVYPLEIFRRAYHKPSTPRNNLMTVPTAYDKLSSLFQLYVMSYNEVPHFNFKPTKYFEIMFKTRDVFYPIWWP